MCMMLQLPENRLITIENSKKLHNILSKDESPSFTFIERKDPFDVLVLCDHASDKFPHNLNSLGLEEGTYDKHWSVDIGALDVSYVLSELLEAPLIYTNYSRLVADLNRRTDHPTFISEYAGNAPIPANMNITPQEKQARIEELYNPYHDKINLIMEEYSARGRIPILISLHSYTKKFFNQIRSWEMGVLWAQDDRVVVPVINGLRGKGYNVGENEPYDMKYLSMTTTQKHGDMRRLPNLLLEMRNDLIDTKDKAEKTARDIFEIIKPVIQDENIRTHYEGEIHVATDIEYEANYLFKLAESARKTS